MQSARGPPTSPSRRDALGFSLFPLKGGEGLFARRAQPDRGVVEHGAAARQTGVGAGQQIDPDALLEGVVGPHPLDDNDALLQPVKGAGMDDDIALAVADAHPLAIGDAEPGQRRRMDERRRPSLAGDARGRVVEARVQK